MAKQSVNATPSVNLAVDILLGWLVPGAGHLSRGYRRQGLIILTVVLALFLTGLVLSDFEAVSRVLHPFAFWAQIGVAGVTLPLMAIDPASDALLAPSVSIQKYQNVPPLNDTGVLFCCIAGLLNFLALFDLVDRTLSPQRSSAQTRHDSKESASA